MPALNPAAPAVMDDTVAEPPAEDRYTKLVKERAMESGLGMQAFVPDWARQATPAAVSSSGAVSVDFESSGGLEDSAGSAAGGGTQSSGSDLDDPEWF